jgi:hypothetical protein
MLLNISDTGVAIQDPPPLKRGDEFVLRLPPTVAQPVAAMLCRVVYSRLMPDGTEVVGAQYIRVLAVAAPHAPTASQEEREHLQQLERRLSTARERLDPGQAKSDA